MKNYKFIIYSYFILSFCVSCHPSKEQLTSLVQEWSNKEILFPPKMYFTLFNNDTIDYCISKSNYKIVVYIDSTDCIDCKILKWKAFIAEIDSLCNNDVQFLFFYQPRNPQKLNYILRKNKFSYPICIDTNNQFYQLNKFLHQLEFHSFLINKNNRIKVIGNPTNNTYIKDLYIQELTGTKTLYLPTTSIQIDTTNIDLGIVKSNETKQQIVTLHNNGSEIFRIKDIITSCSCITTEYNWTEIIPNEKANIKLTYKAEGKGDFWRTITIYGNIPNKSITLNITGYIKSN